MKKTKSIIMMLLAMFVVALTTSCTNDEPNPLAASTGDVQTSTETLDFGYNGGSSSFTVTGGTAFVRSNADWLTVTRVSGDKKSSVFDVECEKNASTEEREGTILVNLNGAYKNLVVTQQSKVVKPSVEYTFRNAQALAADMYPGWNLGNTLEGTSSTPGLADEIGWQSTTTSAELIKYVKSLGFKSIRIPCSWSRHMDSYQNIDAAWMERVKEIVDYCVDEGIYVVLNDHYDENWIENSMGSYDETKAAKLETMWTQIANAFQNYDEHLLFAGLNEPAASTQENTDNLVKYEQVFINAVRATGGNNANRVLVVQGPSTDITNTVNFYNTLPTDSKSDALMVEVHYYNPPQFSGVWEGNGPVWFWGTENLVTDANYTQYNSSSNEADMAKLFDQLQTKFTSQGIPVIIGEYGANWRSVGSDCQTQHDASIKLFYKLVNKYAAERGMVPFAWDINVANQQGTTGVMTIIKRSSKEVFCTPAMEGITEGVAAVNK